MGIDELDKQGKRSQSCTSGFDWTSKSLIT